jgi:hypothetical protein
MGAAGQAGVGYAVRELNKSFVSVVGPTRDHGENEADEEFSRMILGGAGRLLDEGEAEDDVSSEAEDPQNSATAATAQQSWSGPPPAVALLPDILLEALKDAQNSASQARRPQSRPSSSPWSLVCWTPQSASR